MRTTLVALLLVAFCAVAFVHADESKVLTLTDATFDAEVKPSGKYLIKFYAPWCGHCKKIAPTWEELAKSAEGFTVAKVDCTQEKAACARFGIRGFPTVKFFADGKTYDYKGARTIEEFTKFATTGYSAAPAKDVPAAGAAPEKKEAPAKVEEKKVTGKAEDVVVLTEDTFASSTAKGVWLVKFYAPWCGHCKRLVPTWEELATSAKGNFNVAKVDCTIHKDVCSKNSVQGYPTVKLIKDGAVVEEYRGPRTIEGFTSFVKSKSA